MALIDCKFFSETLGQCATMHVLLPQHTTRQIGLSGVQQEGPPKVLYLLHGLSDDHSIWLRRTSIERYVAETGWAVVMPAVHRSFYCNLPNGLYYFDFVADELPALCRQFFGFSSARDRNYVAGLSMGGYGAMKVGLTYPERYQAVASLSGCLDIVATMNRKVVGNAFEMESIFGDLTKLEGSSNDLLALLQKTRPDKLPALYACCGTDDFLYQENQTFRKACEAGGVKLEYLEDPNEAHTWSYWDLRIQSVLQWLDQQST